MNVALFHLGGFGEKINTRVFSLKFRALANIKQRILPIYYEQK